MKETADAVEERPRPGCGFLLTLVSLICMALGVLGFWVLGDVRRIFGESDAALPPAPAVLLGMQLNWVWAGGWTAVACLMAAGLLSGDRQVRWALAIAGTLLAACGTPLLGLAVAYSL